MYMKCSHVANEYETHNHKILLLFALTHVVMLHMYLINQL